MMLIADTDTLHEVEHQYDQYDVYDVHDEWLQATKKFDFRL